ncbi:MAG: hypothetical protein GX660_19460, partial [Clostridiaceae bacterium]|nr:hypothetical protein [Clostridiaceae bacterium]
MANEKAVIANIGNNLDLTCKDNLNNNFKNLQDKDYDNYVELDTKVDLEISNRQNADATINARIDNIVNNPDGNKDVEIVDARNSYSTLKARLDTERQTAIFDRLRQQLVCNELSRIVSDPSNIRRLLFFDETGAVNTIKDRVAGNNAYLSANASSLSPDIVGNARVLNFSNNATWELDPWIEYNASSGNLPNSSSERYPWYLASTSGAVTETISAGKLTWVATIDSTRYYRRENNKIAPTKTKSIEAKAVFGTSGTSDTLRLIIYDGVKGAVVRIYKNGNIRYLDSSSTYVIITTGLNVTS